MSPIKATTTNGSPGVQRRDRRVYRIHEIPDDILAAIEAAEPPAESKAFDDEYELKPGT